MSELFAAFDRHPPDGQGCLDRVYRAFADYDVVYPFCRQCFPIEDELAQRRQKNVRTASYDVFCGIYFEHPTCSGGVDTFKHWLPRQLELALLDYGLSRDDLSTQLIKCGVLTWPEPELAALRTLFARLALNWFGRGSIEPLGYIPGKSPNFVSGPYEGVDSVSYSYELVTILMVLRTDMESFYSWLFDPSSGNGPVAVWTCAGEMLGETLYDHVVYRDTYVVLEDDVDEAQYRQAVAAIQTRAQNDLAHFLRTMNLGSLALRMLDVDPRAAELIEECEAHLVATGLQQTPAQRAAGDAAIDALLP